jgi:peptidoglycan-N-acetylglucosamine deacetylase
MARTVIEQGDVWFAPMEEIARHAMAHRDLLRTDTVSGEPA